MSEIQKDAEVKVVPLDEHNKKMDALREKLTAENEAKLKADAEASEKIKTDAAGKQAELEKRLLALEEQNKRLENEVKQKMAVTVDSTKKSEANEKLEEFKHKFSI